MSSLKQSWVWNHFKNPSNPSHAIGQVMIKSFKCGAYLKNHCLGSTKNFHKHLLKKHNLLEPKPTKKIDTTQSKTTKKLKNGRMGAKMELNGKSLQTALIYIIVDTKLPFSIFKRKYFKNLVFLISEHDTPLMPQIL
ncbi:hypothetical protein VP01_2106g4 [Puccinia sorghi]|uniref:BED-type domain-containing protein n=1 Tax=Puccinia sorghi TaxID=27349 RepID=A0A0L6VAR7_9BASI|nr:hypothetical protein VP01_2106g4 [Puccinia sorghi]